jgi:SAM-dependent methyltransferase
MGAAVSSNINNTFFEGSYKDVWRGLIPKGLTEAEVDFMEDACQLQEGSRVLDLMCGYGRHALELGRRGYKVTAVDNLEAYVNEINSRAREAGLPVEGIVADAARLELEGTYDAIICMGNSFSFFKEEEAVSILQKLSAHLRKGSRLVINSWMIGEIAIRHFKEKDWYSVGPYKCIIDNRYQFNPARVESEQHIIHPDGTIEVTRGVDYIFTLSELAVLLNRAEFSLQEVYSTPRKKPFQLGDSRAYIVAERD